MGDLALPVIKIERANEFYDFEAKYLRDDRRLSCADGLGAAQEAEMQRLAKQAFALNRRTRLGPGGFSDERDRSTLRAGSKYPPG